MSVISNPVPDEVVDCTGLACPLPVLKTAQAMKALRGGQVLELLATDPGVEPDIRAWAGNTGNTVVAIEKRAEVFHVLVRRGQ